MSILNRIGEFRRTLEEAVAERRVASPYGTGLFVDSLPDVYDLNYLRADRPAKAAELAADADRMMEPFLHRKVVLEQSGIASAEGFRALGWQATPHLVMVLRREPDRRVDTAGVRQVSLSRLTSQRAATAAAEHADATLARQLDEAKRRVERAVDTRWFAAFSGDRIAAYCELRTRGGVAQLEGVNTLPRFRGRGLARAVVQHAVNEARRDHDVVFLEALEDDWPHELYTKLGFDVVDTRQLFLLPPSPLTGLRLRTPRLALRLGTVAELRRLARVAQEGIHDPGEMPFEVAWTDRAAEPGFEDDFVDYHLAQLRGSGPDRWRLELLAFHDGEPVGTQGIGAERFAQRREVSTGSWLVRRAQGKGLGTEMRAAALTLAFEGLDARAAVSAAWEQNAASLGVSCKLGYADAGTKLSTPRGEPLVHRVLRLERGSFRSPVPVELEGLEPLRALLGA